jgi:hypothetical protein
MQSSQLASDRSGLSFGIVAGLAVVAAVSISTLATGCSAQDAVERPAPLPPRTISQPLLGADNAGVISTTGTVINTYAKLARDANAGELTVAVDSAAPLGLKAGDLIMVIQMQGASMVATDSGGRTGYGLVANLNSAGQYEIASVKAVDTTSNVITLNYCAGLKHSYSAAGHTQVLRVPQFTSLTVAKSASITAPPWDGDKGGVVAAYVQGKTTVDGTIDVTGVGFRGGNADNQSKPPGSFIAADSEYFPLSRN